MQIKILVEGGKMTPSPALSQKLGPIGLNINSVIQKVNKETESFQGLKVPIELEINPSTKEFDVKIFSPPVSELLKKEFKIERGSGAQKKIKVANASIEQIISVAKTKLPNMLSKNLKSAVKSVVGTCVALGVLIENKPAVEIELEIEEGKYDKEINSEQTKTPDDKKKKIDEFFLELKKKQDEILKQEQAAKEAAKAAVATPTPAAATAPAPTAKTAAKK